MDHSPKNQDQEIDLKYVYQSIGSFSTNIGLKIYKLLMFFKRYSLVLVAIIIGGAGIGFFIDQNQPQLMRHDFIVIPNFGSVDFLYQSLPKRSFVEGKISQEEMAGLKEIKDIQISPIDDIYEFLSNRIENLDVFRIINERGGDIEKVLNNPATTKNFKFHLISVFTKGKAKSEDISAVLFKNLNSQKYYLQRKQIALKNNQIKKQEVVKSLQQINDVLNNIGNIDAIETSQGVNINNYTDIDDLFSRKERIVDNLSRIDAEIIEQSEVVYIVDTMMNNKGSGILKSKTLLLPSFLLVLFLSIMGLRSFLKKYSIISESNLK